MDNQLAQEARGCYELLQRELAPGGDVDAVALAIAKLARYGQALEAQSAGSEAVAGQPLYPSTTLLPSENLILPRIEGE